MEDVSMKRSLWAAVAALGLLCIFCAPGAFGQAVYGSILGTVSDPTGAAVAGAKVTVISETKGTSVETSTNDSGNYSVTHLIPDTYTVHVEGTGFKVLEFKGIQVSADTGSRVDGQFQVGSTTEQVEVTSEAPQLKTDRADVAIEFNSRYVEDLPILNRNFTSLELASPGTQKLSWGHAATENPQGSQQIYVQGQHFSGTAYELDGTDNQDPILGIIVVNPNLDAVTETKFALQNYDAEFGKAVAGVVTAQTKSGSNDVHGSAFWFRRTDATQAKDPFTQWDAAPGVAASPVPPSRWQQFGGSIGGPIIKNKLFFFGDYQATRQSNANTFKLTVPTDRVLSTCNPLTNAASATPGFCDLSDYLTAGIPGGGQAYDPATGTTTGQGGVRTIFGPAGACTGNCIPISRLENADGSPSPAAKILALFPQPTLPGVLNNFLAGGAGPFSQNSFDTRIDYTASSTLNVFGRFSLDYFSLAGKGVLGALGGPGSGLLGLAGSSITHNYSLASGFTKTFSSSLLTDFRFGYFKYNPQTKKPDGGTPMSSFGIPNANTGDPKTAGLGMFVLGTDPLVGENGAANPGGGYGLSVSTFGDGLGVGRCNCPLTESEQQFQWVNNWTKMKGNHQIKVGADIRYAMNLRIPSDNNRTGEYNFSPDETSSGTAGLGGLDFASFLLGDVSLLSRYVDNPSLPSAGNAAERQKRWFFYGQDTYRATTKLTINYGLRWEIYFPESVNTKGNGGFANIVDNGGTGVIRVAGFGPYGLNGNVENSLHAFAPRLGIAYQLTPKTVLRMGYGRSYDMGVFGSNFGHTVTQNLPVLVKQNIDASAVIAGADPNFIPVFTLSQGPIAPVFPAIPANGQIPFSSLGGQDSGVHIRPIRQTLPTLDAWNVTVQHQVTNTISAEIAYVGNKGSHGFSGDNPNYDVNPVSMFLYGTGAASNLRRPLCDPVFTVAPGTPGVTPLGSCTRIGDDLGNFYGNDASSNYNALEAKVQKRFASGLQFVAHYTFSHANFYDGTYYAISHPVAYGPNDFTRNNVFVINTVYQLPFGKGKPFLGNASRALDYAVGGWQLSNTTNWSSGLPWTPSTSQCGGEEDVNVCRPNKGSGSFHTGPGSFDGATHQVTFFTPLPSLTGPFTDPGIGNLGNIGHDSFRGPSGFYSDLSLTKDFPIFERVKLQFRMDAFNVFNHPVYAFSGNNGANPCIDCANTTPNGTNGKITDIEGGTTMRELQFALRLNF
jgi:Carboxypeptidase regulatory-like domain/TonB dependent receptor-like, beta-barrel